MVAVARWCGFLIVLPLHLVVGAHCSEVHAVCFPLGLLDLWYKNGNCICNNFRLLNFLWPLLLFSENNLIFHVAVKIIGHICWWLEVDASWIYKAVDFTGVGRGIANLYCCRWPAGGLAHTSVDGCLATVFCGWSPAVCWQLILVALNTCSLKGGNCTLPKDGSYCVGVNPVPFLKIFFF